jgi:hypothetical protein
MLSDMVWGGSIHRHIMTRGGKRAPAARTAQLDTEFKPRTKPARHTAATQRMASMAFIVISCIE